MFLSPNGAGWFGLDKEKTSDLFHYVPPNHSLHYVP